MIERAQWVSNWKFTHMFLYLWFYPFIKYRAYIVYDDSGGMGIILGGGKR